MLDLDQVVKQALAEFGGTDDPNELERIKARYLGKSGVLGEARKYLSGLPPERRRDAGTWRSGSTPASMEPQRLCQGPAPPAR